MVDAVLSDEEGSPDRDEHLLLKDQQEGKQDERDKECRVGNVAMEEEIA
jgi:hypothetical protein